MELDNASRCEKCENHKMYRNIARVVGKIGKAGEVKVVPIDDLPFLLHEGQEVFLTPPRLTGLRSAIVERIAEMGDGWSVKFEGCDDQATAFELEGRLCLVDESDLPDLDEEQDPTLLIGMQVVDARKGALGEVVDLILSPEQTTLIIGDANIMIPFVEEYVQDIGDDTIYVSIPDALLELND